MREITVAAAQQAQPVQQRPTRARAAQIRQARVGAVARAHLLERL